MKTKWRKIPALILIGALMFLGAAMEWSHTDCLPNASAKASVESNGEQHLYAAVKDSSLYCLSCFFLSTHIAVSFDLEPIDQLQQNRFSDFVELSSSYTTLLIHFSLRAPPSALA